jgi:transposase
MTRRKFSREFKIEAVRLVTDRDVTVAQAARDLDVAESVLRRWMRELTATPAAAFPGNGQMRSDLAEIAALKKEVARLRAERDILKKASLFSRGRCYEVRLHRQTPPHLAGQLAVRGSGGLAFGLQCLAQPYIPAVSEKWSLFASGSTLLRAQRHRLCIARDCPIKVRI